MERRLSDARAERLRTQPTGYRGQMFELLMRSGIGYEAVTAHRTNVWVAEAVATLTGREPAKPTVTAAMRAVRTHFLEADPDWQMSFELRTMLMLHRSLPDPANLETVEAWLGEAVDGFLRFEAKFWTLPSEDPNAPHRPYLRKEFHRRWVYSILAAVLTGGQLLILSPPRHGKTELLQHLCVWLICRNPNIRIIWVGPNGQTAQDTVGAIREMLENNTSLITEVCGPAGSFAPVLRSGSKWTDARFTVATRTILGMKAPTVTAQGKDAKLLSKDADLIVGDDIEDYDSTETPGARESGRTWFYTQLETRKQVRTAWFLIGSRQHPDDLYGYLIDDPTWQSIITAAHDQNCRRDPEEILAHVDCMLFPEVNPYVWLYTKWKGALARAQEHLYEMVYLNNPQPEGMIQWTRELAMRAANVGRGLGLQGIKLTAGSEFHLIAGLDPSATMFQAAFCWGVELIWPDPDTSRPAGLKLWAVDSDNRLGGGVDAFIDGPGQGWLDAYRMRHWVVEDNLYRQAFSKHPRLLTWAAANSVAIESIQTQGPNKHDKVYGVGAMRRLWTEDPIRVDLPYGDAIARSKTDAYVTQLLRYTDDPAKLKHRTTDMLMASWFPQRSILIWFNELLARLEERFDEEEAMADLWSSYDGVFADDPALAAEVF